MSKPKAISKDPRETERQDAELAAMCRMLNISSGTTSLSIAICNSPELTKYLIGKIKKQIDSIEVVHITEEATDVFNFVKEKVLTKNPAAIFITGIEKKLPSDAKEHKILKALNATRELWKNTYSCPVVFWTAEYAATLFSLHARDIWSWLSHQFEFFSEGAHVSMGINDGFSGDITAASNLGVDQKHFRIAELKQRIQEAGDIKKSELTGHVLLWLSELAFLNLRLGDLTQAESTIKKSLEINEKLGRSEWMAIDYGNLGNIYHTLGNLNRAEEMYKKSLEINKKLERFEGIAIAYSGLGVTYQAQGDLDKAEVMFKKSLKIEEKLGRAEERAVDYCNLGLIYNSRGDLSKAEEMLKKSLAINEKIGLLEGIAISHANLGLIYQTKGDLDKAGEMYTKSLEIAEKLGHQKGIAVLYTNIGTVYQMRGETDKALEYWKKSRDIYTKMGVEDMATEVQGWIDEISEKQE